MSTPAPDQPPTGATQPRDQEHERGKPENPHPQEPPGRPSDYLANERTFLAWLRTGIALVALGFVVARFGLLLRELAASAGARTGPTTNHISSLFGTAIVILSALFLILSYLRYRRTDQALARGAYTSDRVLIAAVASVVTAIAILLAVYLLTTS